LQESGFKETGAGFFKVSTDDFSSQVAGFKAAGAQILSGFMFEGHFATLWKQALQMGYRPEVVTMAAAFLFPSAMKAMGPAGNGMSTEVWWTPDYPYRSSLTGQTARQLASAWEASTGQQWTQPLGYAHAVWEVGLNALKTSEDPYDRTAVRNAIRDTTLETIVGTVDFKKSPIKSVAVTSLAGGQWRRTADGARFPFELRVVNNAFAKHVRVVDELRPLSKLR
jgi:branched-chain amino acid transport system substrate-binding protein